MSHLIKVFNRSQAAVIGLIYKLLDDEGRGNLQTFCPCFAPTVFLLFVFDYPTKDYRLTVLEILDH